MNLLKLVDTKNYINGNFITYHEQLSVTNPSTLELIGTVPKLSDDLVTSAVDNSVKAFESWSKSPFEQRIAILRKWNSLILENIDELAHILTLEQGKVLEDAKREIIYGASFIDWYAGAIHNIQGKIKPGKSYNHKITTEYEPVGPVAAITPWNFPVAMVTRKVAPAIAAGCSVILKPSS